MIITYLRRIIRVAIQARRAVLVEKAMPTLRAFGIFPFYGRSIERLWLDGGSFEGFQACRKLGWATLTGRRVNGEAMGILTNAGRYVLTNIEGTKP